MRFEHVGKRGFLELPEVGGLSVPREKRQRIVSQDIGRPGAGLRVELRSLSDLSVEKGAGDAVPQ